MNSAFRRLFEKFGWFKRGTAVQPRVIAWGTATERNTNAEAAYKNVGWVNRCVRAIATNVQQAEVYGVTRRGDSETRLPDIHPLSQLIARPDAENDFSFLLEGISSHLDLRGESLLEMESGEIAGKKTPPSRLYLHPSQWIYDVKFERDTRGYTEFILNVGGQKFPVPGADCIFFKLYNPENPIRGLAPMTAAWRAADADYSASIFNRDFMENSGVLSGILSFDGPNWADSQLTEEMRDRVLERTRAFMQRNRHGVMVTGPGETFKPITGSVKDMDFEILRKFNAREIQAVFGVPPILCGDVENANRANSKEQRAMFWMDTVIPRIQDIESLLNRKMAPRFGADIRIKLDYSNVPALRRDLKEFAESWIPLLTSDAVEINEVRAELNKPPVPWGTGPWSNRLNEVKEDPDEKPSEDTKPGKPAGDSEDDKALRLAKGWKNAVLCRIHNGATTPMQAFPMGTEIRKAVKKYGIPRELAGKLANLVRTEIAVNWDSSNPANSIGGLFERYEAELKKSA